MKKQMLFKTKGMNRDLSVSAFNPEFAFENRNLRLGTNSANTMMSWVNEKGTASIPIVTGNWVAGDDSTLTTVTSLTGTPIGTAVINHQLVVFTTDTTNVRDYIYVLKYADSSKTSMLCKMLFGSSNVSIGFDVNYPLETLVSYESEKIQKVYWTDGKNQPRVINIEAKQISQTNLTQFDFVPELQLQEEVKILKKVGSSGMFAPGVIQYAFTYYYKYGQESCIFYTSPLLYISHIDRGASPEDKVDNAFQITVSGLDTKFDYLRIYSIHRTSIDATPVCKRIQDIAIDGLTTVSYLDNGLSGDSIDPMELLYKGGEEITAETLEQKDNTLFLGNIKQKRPFIESTLRGSIESNTVIEQDSRTFMAKGNLTDSYPYACQLNSTNVYEDNSVPCGGFKYGDIYRCGVQFQYKTGKWSDPIFIADVPINGNTKPSITVGGQNNDTAILEVPSLKGTLRAQEVTDLMNAGYIKARAVVVFPNIQDRVSLCQGVVCPTMYTNNQHDSNKEASLYAQSSWFFRIPGYTQASINSKGAVAPIGNDALSYTGRGLTSTNPGSGVSIYDPTYIKSVEVQGCYDPDNMFRINRGFLTMHSPDLEFDSQTSSVDFSNTTVKKVGDIPIINTYSDIDIQTETPATSSSGAGFVHKSFAESGGYGIVSGLFYDDFAVDDADGDKLTTWINQKSSVKWMVYAWNKSGSLNNDINRPANLGIASAILKKKVISNLRIFGSVSYGSYGGTNLTKKPQLFSSNELSILKFGSDLYQGNIDTMLIPDYREGYFFSCGSSGGSSPLDSGKNALFTSSVKSQLTAKYKDGESDIDDHGVYHYIDDGGGYKWLPENGDGDNIGNYFNDLVLNKESVRMKYKSTPHVAFEVNSGISWNNFNLPVVELLNPVNNKRFGGSSIDAKRENVWIPCGPPRSLISGRDITFLYMYGDTYYQRWDCLKTYPFTKEDINQIVEIGSFMLETRVNIDGRYDRNRGQRSNLNMSPVNFNLLNPIYSQVDNFFQYRIQDTDFYNNDSYYNQITWSLPKNSGSDTDEWTHITLANALELDGDKGKITSLQRFDNQLICFQETGISRVLYNDNYMLSTQEGVPIEIANSGKVQGKDYLSNTVGCANKWSIVLGNAGLYFMDANQKSIYLLNQKLNSISEAGGFNAWSKLYIPSGDVKWNTTFPVSNSKSPFVAYHDKMNQEVFFINHDLCLAFSEKFGVFTSFYDYQNTPFFSNIDDTGVWLRGSALWKHQAGSYCTFFGTRKPYSMILVGNPEPQISKIFTNVEFRACVDGDGTETSGKFTPYLPFDSLDTWNEYQHGMANLSNRTGHAAMQHHTTDNAASLKRKFRIWRCDIPRDNGEATDTFSETFPDSFHTISRIRKHPLDRMRNPWLYLRFRKDSDSNRRVEIHDIMMTYFD